MDNREEAYKECMEILKNITNGILLLSPRIGKSKIAIGYIKKHDFKKILWVTPDRKLRDNDIPLEFSKWKAKKYLKRTNIICYSSLKNITENYDLIILDEIQYITKNNIHNILHGIVNYKSIIGLTGTLPEHEEKLDIIKKLKMPILKKITIDEAVSKNMVADYKIKVVEIPLDSKSKNIVAGSKKKPFKTTEYSNYNYLCNNVRKASYSNNPNLIKWNILKRLRFIYESPSKFEVSKKLLNFLDGRKLIFMGSIESAEKISKHTFHSKTKSDSMNKFLNQEIDTLACVNSGGVGYTYEKVDHFIISQSDSNKSGNFIQKLTRSILIQKDYIGSIWVLCLMGTQDEIWVENALKTLDQSKIEYINVKNLFN